MCALLRRERIDPANRKTCRETDARHPVGRRRTALGRWLTFDLVQ